MDQNECSQFVVQCEESDFSDVVSSRDRMCLDNVCDWVWFIFCAHDSIEGMSWACSFMVVDESVMRSDIREEWIDTRQTPTESQSTMWRIEITSTHIFDCEISLTNTSPSSQPYTRVYIQYFKHVTHTLTHTHTHKQTITQAHRRMMIRVIDRAHGHVLIHDNEISIQIESNCLSQRAYPITLMTSC
jgi:hypothetical protein